MVEVFKTNVVKTAEANRLINLLLQHFPGSRINFDLEDCDKVLRVEANDPMPHKIITLVRESGFMCGVLE
jgi:hypothetical protein